MNNSSIPKLTLHFLTLVLVLFNFSASGSPHDSAPSPQSEDLKSADQNRNVIDENNLILSEPPTSSPAPQPIEFFPYKNSLAARFGLLIDMDLARDGSIPYFFGFQCLFPRSQQPQFELGADIFSHSKGQINAGLRHGFYPYQYFRPYVKLGVAHQTNSNENLATFFAIKNYMAKFAIGFEDVLALPKSVRIELEAGLSIESTAIYMSLGYSWSW